MRLAAYQFAVCGELDHNLEIVKKTVIQAAENRVDLIVFPECALTGYPPRDIAGSDCINVNGGSEAIQELQKLADELDIVLFYDVADKEDESRYQMIKGHLITRAVENVTPVLSVNAICPKQTAPTCFVNASGAICKELEENVEGMLIYDFEKQELNFGELGRKRYSDQLLNEHNK